MIKEQVITNRGGVFDAENIITGGCIESKSGNCPVTINGWV